MPRAGYAEEGCGRDVAVGGAEEREVGEVFRRTGGDLVSLGTRICIARAYLLYLDLDPENKGDRGELTHALHHSTP